MSRLPAGAHPGATAAMLPVAVGALILVAIHACYLVSASLGHVNWCMPYIDGCTTISRASRVEPEVFIYRAMIGASAVLMIPYWRTTGILHGLLGAGQHAALRRVFVVLGVIAGVSLAVNASILGSNVDWVRGLRRVCVITFFVLSFVAAALSTFSLARVAPAGSALRGPLRVKTALTALMAGLGVLNYVALPLSATLQQYENTLQNAIEWNWVALLCGFFIASAFVWRAARLSPHWTASA